MIAASRLHRLLIASALVAGLWGLRTDVLGPAPLHFLGAAALTLMFGLRAALAGMALAALLAALLGGTPLAAIPGEWFTDGLVPVLATAGVHRAAVRFLPANVFVYVFVVAYAGAGVSMLCALGARAWLFALPTDSVAALGLMLAFGEAFLTGMLMTLFVVYRHDWVASFDDAHWLRPR